MLKTVRNLLCPKGPTFLVHFLTNRCNANCTHCFIFSREVLPRYKGCELALAEIKKMMPSLAPTLVSVSLTGGEPFLREDINEIVNLYVQVAEVGAINITTNASLPERIAESVARMIHDNPQTNFSITLSIDNLDQKHDKNRKFPGLFRRLIATYRKLGEIKSTKLTVGFNLTVTPNNERDLQKIYEYLTKKLGARAISPTALRFGPRCEGADFLPKNYAKLNRLINRGFIGGALEGQHGFCGADFYNAKNMLMRDFVAQTIREKKWITPCQAGRLAGVLHANGDVYPCELLERKMGNLRQFDYDFDWLWQSPAAIKIRKFVADTKCFCTYECFLGLDFLANPKFYPQIMRKYLKIKRWS